MKFSSVIVRLFLLTYLPVYSQMAREQIESSSYIIAKNISFRLKYSLIPPPFTFVINDKWISQSEGRETE